MLVVAIVSDVSCPWCIIGYTNLQAALDECHQSAEISWKPFELNPQMPRTGQAYADYSREKYYRTKAEATANLEHITRQGVDAGFEFNLSEHHRIYNTFDAHRVLYWAKEFGLQTQLKLALFDHYFKRSGDLSDHGALLDCAKKVGLDREAAATVLSEGIYSDEVSTELRWAHEHNIHSVPTFIFNDKQLVTGGRSKEAFVQILGQLNEHAL